MRSRLWWAWLLGAALTACSANPSASSRREAPKPRTASAPTAAVALVPPVGTSPPVPRDATASPPPVEPEGPTFCVGPDCAALADPYGDPPAEVVRENLEAAGVVPQRQAACPTVPDSSGWWEALAVLSFVAVLFAIFFPLRRSHAQRPA